MPISTNISNYFGVSKFDFQVGWEGVACDVCVPMPGCDHGHCNQEAFGCTCDDETQYTGALCDNREKNISVKAIWTLI